jgi:hypothetical protein
VSSYTGDDKETTSGKTYVHRIAADTSNRIKGENGTENERCYIFSPSTYNNSPLTFAKGVVKLIFPVA